MNIDVTASDIVDAIHQMYEDDPVTEAAYMVKLCGMGTADVLAMSHVAYETRDYEPYVEAYCPMCDMEDE